MSHIASNPSIRPLSHFHKVSPGLMTARDTGFGLLVSAVIILASYVLPLRSPVLPVDTGAENVPTNSIITKIEAPKPKPKTSAVISKPDAGLQAILNKWQKTYPNGRSGVVVKELGGEGRFATLNDQDSFYAASLYKLFLADYVYNQISDGNLSLKDQLSTGQSLDTCLNRMIILSDNNCAHAVGNFAGWNNVNNFIHANGFTKSVINPTKYTTAADLANYLEQLYQGKLMAKKFKDQLITNMENQIYRESIPGGSPGITVADKPGFVIGVWHDVAIVYHPKGAYVLVVLQAGYGSGAIINLTQRLNAYFYK